MKQARIFISGFVQGVGFRSFIKRHAQRLGITGFVKNLPDDRVEAVFQSVTGNEEDEDVQELIKLCNHGPMLSEVEEVVVEWEEVKEIFSDFDIRH